MRCPLLCALALLSQACVTVPNVTVCSAAGSIRSGMICAQTNVNVTSEMNFDQTMDFLEPSTNPERAGAMCMTAKDWTKMKTALEQACRQAGSKCQYEKPK